MITREQYIEQFGKNLINALELTKRKCTDYSGDEDPYMNFRHSALISGVAIERGIVMRMGDKLQRISNLLDRPAQVADEKITDTLLDMLVYSNILLTYLQLNVPEHVPLVKDAPVATTESAVKNAWRQLFTVPPQKSVV